MTITVTWTGGGADSAPAHRASGVVKPTPWPGGVIPYDISKLSDDQQKTVKRAMRRWMDTGAQISFVPRDSQKEYVYFTGSTNSGNNTSFTGFHPGSRTEINITAFWWRQGEWMPVHELGHALGFHHEHARWDRDEFLTVHYEHIKPGRSSDYDWIPREAWLVDSTPYDYYSIMHYRVCWTSACEPECKDGDGSSPCAVLDPVGTNYDRVIGQWTENRLSATDAEEARRAYGTNRTTTVEEK
jgi:tolloid protein